MYRDASHLWRSFSHNRTKINIQFLIKPTNHVHYSTASQFESPVIFSRRIRLLRKNPVNVSLTINYDDNTNVQYLSRIIRWKGIERKKYVYIDCCCVCWCDGAGFRAALSLVESYDETAIMNVVDTIFIISVSNYWMFTYRDKWHSHGKIVNSCFPFIEARRVYFDRDCLRTEFVIITPVRI